MVADVIGLSGVCVCMWLLHLCVDFECDYESYMLTEYSCIQMKSNLLWKSLSIGRCTAAPVYSTRIHQQVLPTWKQEGYCNCCSTLALQLYPSKTTTSRRQLCIHLQSSPGSIEIDLWEAFFTSMIIMIMGGRVSIPWPKNLQHHLHFEQPMECPISHVSLWSRCCMASTSLCKALMPSWKG